MGIRDLVRRAAKRVARAVEKDDLFEKAGERPRTAPFPVKAAPERAGSILPKTASNVESGRGVESAPVAPVAAAPVVAPAAVAPAPAPAPVVAPAAAPAPAPAPVVAPAPAPAAAPAQAVTAKRPVEGCVAVDLAGLRAALAPSGKPLVINHWATWCDPCVDELPRLVRAAAGVADLGEFIGVSWDLFDHPGKPAVVARKVGQFADNAGVGYASVLFTGSPEELFAFCNLDIHQIPQTVVLAPDGRVVYHKKGVIDHDDVFPLINAVKSAR